ncbi:hypothetical protein [Lapillicoccus jejuensis]|uniref:Arginyl-tRNA synthetase n=1 Tax=Lapillicoccus jejuensis TaxID=402171 RepID=A0A542E041_9MICO|nr:hypothetical protein [Lapillicoccus jejuensis]TQJ08698.1 hypothetical protein FB458_1790 [Lapillicoccus jejuensis]
MTRVRSALDAALRRAGLEAGVPEPGDPGLVPSPEGPGWRSPAPARWAGAAGLPVERLAGLLAAALGRDPDVASVAVLGDRVVDVVPVAPLAWTVVAQVLGDPSYGGSRVPPGQVPLSLVRRPEEPVFLAAWARSRALRVADTAAAVSNPGTPAELDDVRLALLARLADHPDAVRRVPDAPALLRRVADLAAAARTWLDGLGADPAPTDAALARATAQVLEDGLSRLGVAAPVRL